jgi:hypothetical protein
MAASKIPPALEGEILARYGAGEGGESIAAWLLSAHGIQVSDRAVRNFLEKKRKEREPIARAVIVEAVTKTVTRDLDALESMILRAQTIGMNPLLHPGTALDAIKVELAIRTTRLKFSGGDEPDAPQAGAKSAVILLSPRRAIASPQIPTSPPTSSESPTSGSSEGDLSQHDPDESAP